ncbi:MAG: NTP transferase domain-containing protein [Spirochaetes bacterium]|nr:NTP transferase domain-containing protein [Spirochaetota bacterium]
MKPTLLILAAGMGSRFGGLKQVEPVGPNGEKILDYSIYDALRAGFGGLVFVIRREIEADFRQLVSRRYEGLLPVRYVFQDAGALPPGFSVPPGRTKPWGTAHAILCARADIPGNFGVINADDFYGKESFGVLSSYLQGAADSAHWDWSMVGYPLGNTLSENGQVSRGICRVSPLGELETVREVQGISRVSGGAQAPQGSATESFTGKELVSLNLWGFTPSLFAHLEEHFPPFLGSMPDPLKSEFQIPGLVDRAIHDGKAKVRVLTSPGRWYGVTYKEDKPVVAAAMAALVQSGAYPSPLWKERGAP